MPGGWELRGTMPHPIRREAKPSNRLRVPSPEGKGEWSVGQAQRRQAGPSQSFEWFRLLSVEGRVEVEGRVSVCGRAPAGRGFSYRCGRGPSYRWRSGYRCVSGLPFAAVAVQRLISLDSRQQVCERPKFPRRFLVSP
jgi:hypothetical protein